MLELGVPGILVRTYLSTPNQYVQESSRGGELLDLLILQAGPVESGHGEIAEGLALRDWLYRSSVLALYWLVYND